MTTNKEHKTVLKSLNAEIYLDRFLVALGPKALTAQLKDH